MPQAVCQPSLRRWRSVAQRRVWSDRVVVNSPVFCQHSDFLQRVEDLAIQEFTGYLALCKLSSLLFRRATGVDPGRRTRGHCPSEDAPALHSLRPGNVCGENWIEEWIRPVRKTDADFHTRGPQVNTDPRAACRIFCNRLCNKTNNPFRINGLASGVKEAEIAELERAHWCWYRARSLLIETATKHSERDR